MTTTTTQFRNADARLVIDYENNAEEWWDAARALADSVRYPEFTRIFNRLATAELDLECSQNDTEQFLEVARTLPEWESGPSYAPNPVLVVA